MRAAALHPVRSDLVYFAGTEFTLGGSLFGPIVVHRWDGTRDTGIVALGTFENPLEIEVFRSFSYVA